MKKKIALIVAAALALGAWGVCRIADRVPPHISTTLEERTPLLIDSDGNISDFYALAYVGTCDKLDLRAITATHGAVRLEQAGVNLLSAAEFYGFSCPVALGARRPLGRQVVYQSGADGENGLGGVILPTPKKEFDRRPAWEVMYEVARAEEGRLQIVCMGPLTNVATAIETYPDFAGMVAGITTTAGFSALDKMPTRDGVTALPVMISEPDLFNDQDAFVKVLGSGIPIKSIGTSTDPTYRLGYTPEKNKENTLDKWLSPDSDYSVTFSRIRQHFKASGKYRDQAAFPSVMAMLSLIDANLLTFEDLPVQQVSFDATDVLLRRADGGEDALGDLQRLTGFADIMAYNDAFFYMPRYYHQYR